MEQSFVLKGHICHSENQKKIAIHENSYLVCVDGHSQGIFGELPAAFANLPLKDYGDRLIVPGLVDLHVHAPQFSFRGTGMDLELLDWLDTYTFPEESKYENLDYAKAAYAVFIDDVRKGPNTRASIFATVHVEATLLLMDLLEESGLSTLVGRSVMDRNCPDSLRETTAAVSTQNTVDWLAKCQGRYSRTAPIVTPRFLPSCTDDCMTEMDTIRTQNRLPVQSHLSENKKEIEWVQSLYPGAESYGHAYNQFGMFGGNAPTIMAHCVWSAENEVQLMKENGVFVAHSPQSNINLSSGIAPIRKYLNQGIHVGLGSDVAGGCHTSIFRAMADAIQVSKLYWRLIDENDAPLTVDEAFYLGTKGGGAYFGQVGCFAAGFEFDAVVLDDSSLATQAQMGIKNRLERLIYLSDDRNIVGKYVKGSCLF